MPTLFDREWYLAQYLDIAVAGVDPLTHFLEHGWREGRDPHPLFDTDWYLWRYPDVAAAGINPWNHYLRDGHRERRRPNPLFDPVYYLEQHPEVAGGDPLTHYVTLGRDRGFQPNPFTGAVDSVDVDEPYRSLPPGSPSITVVIPPASHWIHLERCVRALRLTEAGNLDTVILRPSDQINHPWERLGNHARLRISDLEAASDVDIDAAAAIVAASNGSSCVLRVDAHTEPMPGFLAALLQELSGCGKDFAVAARLVDAVTGRSEGGRGDRVSLRWVDGHNGEGLVIEGSPVLDHEAEIAQMAGEQSLSEWDIPNAIPHLSRACDLAPNARRTSRLASALTMGAEPGRAAQVHTLWRSHLGSGDSGLAPGRDLVGEPSSWDHIRGEIIEASSGETFASDCRAAIAGPDPKQAMRVVDRHPESVMASIALLITLRRAAALAPHPAVAAAPIPTRIVQAWFDSPLPADARELSNSWAHHNPAWEHQVFVRETADRWIDTHYGGHVLDAFRAAAHPATAADLFRLAFLADRGGVWADIDDRCLSPLDPFVAGRALVLVQESFGTVAVNFIAAEARHPMIVAAVHSAADRILAGLTRSTWVETGPGLLTRELGRWLVPQPPGEVPADLLIATEAEFAKFVASHQALDYKRSPRSWWIAETS